MDKASVTIHPDDFDVGSALVRPTRDPASGAVLGLIAPKILNWMAQTGLPLNRKTAACVRAVDPNSIMTPVNLPAGLSRTRPKSKPNIIGLYDGGDYFDCDVFHPAGVCNMRMLERQGARSARYCHVCRYLIVDRVDGTRHIDLDTVYRDNDYPEPP
jgi:hypothetical protein